jgi:hypothetical protein
VREARVLQWYADEIEWAMREKARQRKDCEDKREQRNDGYQLETPDRRQAAGGAARPGSPRETRARRLGD